MKNKAKQHMYINFAYQGYIGMLGETTSEIVSQI